MTSNRTKIIILSLSTLIFCLCLSGCKSLNPTLLNPQMNNERLLPPLTPVFNEESFGTVIPLFISSGDSKMFGLGFGSSSTEVAIIQSFSKTITYRNPVINDLKTIFERDVERNITASSNGQQNGTIKCRLIDGKHSEGLGWCIFSSVTLGLFNLLGMPVSSNKYNLQIEVAIFDNNNNLVGRYTSDFHNQKSYMALYWGYSESNAPRNSARIAFTKAMEDIKQQIEKDFDRLNRALR